MMTPWRKAAFGAASTALIAFACAHEPEMVWVKPGGSEDDFYRMRAYCASQTEMAVLSASAAKASFAACMQSDGWVRMSKEEARQPKFTWVRTDGTPAPLAELEAAREECRASSHNEPGSPLYSAEVMQCVQGKGYRLVEEKQ
jgi:hypothetical protein